jgi:Flp pilus assembly protein TadG
MMKQNAINMLASQLLKNKGGNVGIMFGLAILPLLAAVGAAVDYNRATDLRAEMQRAADAAALAAAKETSLSPSQQKALAEKVFHGHLRHIPVDRITLNIRRTNDMGVEVEATTQMPTEFMSIFKIDKMYPRVVSKALVGSDTPVEIALVMDNTGSMQNDMPELKTATRAFIENVFHLAGVQVKMSIVPYVAAVNVGNEDTFSPNMLDHEGQSAYHGSLFKRKPVAYDETCAPDVSLFPPGGGNLSPTGKDRTNLEVLWQFTENWLGISKAFAYGTLGLTPGLDLSGTPISGGTAIVPAGFVTDNDASGCPFLRNPIQVSHFDLFDRLPGVRWKGCVEARPDPYDVTDAPPSPSDVDTLIVPYFWPDHKDPYGAGLNTHTLRNSYLTDGDVPNSLGGFHPRLPVGWTTYWLGDPSRPDIWKGTHNIFKYNNRSPISIVETPPSTLGPNAGCPTRMQRLTSNRSLLENKINEISYWHSGGTITSEGIMWGWRSLSPNLPFADGAPLGTVRKVMVVMSDGRNSLMEENRGGPIVSDYTAYGVLRGNPRIGNTFEDAENFLNERMRLACQNAKTMGGITIYTILYRETDINAQKLMRECATSPSYAFLASNGGELLERYTEISKTVTRLRISR